MSQTPPTLEGALDQLLRRIVKEEIQAALHPSGDNNGHPEKWFYSSKEAAHLIGIPKSWLESAAKRGEVKRIQFGHYKVFPREELERFAEQHKKNNAP